MLPSEYAPLWRDYVAAFGELVEPASRDPAFPAAQRLVRAEHISMSDETPLASSCRKASDAYCQRLIDVLAVHRIVTRKSLVRRLSWCGRRFG